MYDLSTFSLREMTTCGAALREIGEGAHTMEQVSSIWFTLVVMPPRD